MKRYTDWDRVAWEVVQYEVVDPFGADFLGSGASGSAYVMLPYKDIVKILGAKAWTAEGGDYPEIGWGIQWGDGLGVMIAANTKHYEIGSNDPEQHFRALRAHEEDWTVWFPYSQSGKEKEIFDRLKEIFGDKVITYREWGRSGSLRVKRGSRWVVDDSSYQYFTQNVAPYQIWDIGSGVRLLFIGNDATILANKTGPSVTGTYVEIAKGAWCMDRPPSDEDFDYVRVYDEGPKKHYYLVGTWTPAHEASLAIQEPRPLGDVLRTVESWVMSHPTYDEMKKTLEGPRGREKRRLPGSSTYYHYDNQGGAVAVRYHATDVVTFYPNYIVLDTGGWNSMTTASRMSAYLSQANLPYRVTRRKWSISLVDPTNWKLVAPVNRMLVMDYEGAILANGESESEKYIQDNPQTPVEQLG